MKIIKILAVFFCGLGLVFVLQQAIAPNAIPVFEKGHRLYGVPNRKAAAALETIFKRQGGLTRDRAFAAGPTKQILFTDNTVLIMLGPEKEALPLDLTKPPPGTSISLVSSNPRLAASNAVAHLRLQGFEAKQVEFPMEGLPEGLFAFVRSNACDNDSWLIVFRWHVMSLGGKPTAIDFPNEEG